MWEKKERLSILQQRLSLQASRYSQALNGTSQRVLVTGLSKKSKLELSGRTECNRIVNFDGDPRLIGQFIDIDITDVQPNSLRGRIPVLQT